MKTLIQVNIEPRVGMFYRKERGQGSWEQRYTCKHCGRIKK